MSVLKKHTSAIAFILVVIMVISILSVSTDGFGLLHVKAEQARSDVKVAGDISNITGIDADTILSKRNEGLSWNEILDELKDVQYKNGNSRDDRNNTLLNQSLPEDLVNQLQNEGFSEEDIIEARLLIERVQFQLNEIADEEGQSVSVGFGIEPEAELSAYRDLAANINLAECLPFLLLLENDFGSHEKVLDEYLLCLQLNMELSLYIEDKEAYLKEKSIRGSGKNLITVQSIEERMLMKLQKKNEEKRDTLNNDVPVQTDVTLTNQGSDNIVPDAPVPRFDSLVPQNPADALMNEINNINPMVND